MSVPLFVFSNERRGIYKQRKLLEQLSESEVQQHCGLPWWGVREILHLFSQLEGKTPSAIPVETKVLTFLSLLRSGAFQWTLGSLAGISQPSASRAIEACTNLLLESTREHISFPSNYEAISEIKRGFHEIAQFPNIVGVIDGTHIPIKAPNVNENVFVNRKQYHSINVQVVVDNKFQFTDILARWPGSTHDSFIWNNCGLKRTLNTTLLSGWLIGDSGYPLESILLTPYPASSTNPIELTYNKSHAKTRCLVEQTIGHWKSRFRALCRSGGYLSYCESKTCELIISAGILHNICKRYQIPVLPEDNADWENSSEELDVELYEGTSQQSAPEIRRRIAEHLHNVRR